MAVQSQTPVKGARRCEEALRVLSMRLGYTNNIKTHNIDNNNNNNNNNNDEGANNNNQSINKSNLKIINQ